MRKIVILLVLVFFSSNIMFAGLVQELMKLAEIAYSNGSYEEARRLYISITQLEVVTTEQRSIAQHNINICNTKIEALEYEIGYSRAYRLFTQKKYKESRNKCRHLLSYSRYANRTNKLIEQCTDSIKIQLKIKHLSDSIQSIQVQLYDEYNDLIEQAYVYYNNKLYEDARICYNRTLDSKFRDIVPKKSPEWLSRCDSIIEYKKAGGVVVTPKLAKTISGAIYLGDFSEGFAYIELEDSTNKRGKFIINTDGDIICKAYSALQEFHDGYLAVEPFGFINTKGEYLDIMDILDIDVRASERFTEGMAPIKNDHGKWGYIDNKFNLVIKPKYDYVSAFREGLALVRAGSKWSYINKTGKTVIKSFKPGMDGGLCGYEHYYSYFSDGISWIWNKKEGGIVGINKNGEICLKGVVWGLSLVNDYLFYWPHFNNGLCPYGISTNYGKSLKFGFIDVNGSLKIPQIYDKVYPFKEGVAMVVKDGLTGFVNVKGEIVIPLTNHHYGQRSFSEGLIPIKLNKLYGYLNIKKQVVISPRFIDAKSFHCGLAVVRDNKGQCGYVDIFGNSTFDFK